MAHELKTPAYRTRLGNPSAKSVLASLVEHVNPEGYGFPGLERIAEQTEIKLRTVKRMIQVFEAIGLVRRVPRRDGRRGIAIEVNVGLLESDLSEPFACAYRTAQGKDEATGDGLFTPSKCRSDMGVNAPPDVAATPNHVAATPKDVAATFPPDPHIGGTVSEPLLNLPPMPPKGGGVVDCLSVEQEEHLARCVNEGQRAYWRERYLDENRETREREALERAAELARQQEQARLRAELGTLEAAVAWVMRHCGWVDRGRGRGLSAAVRAVLEADAQTGTPLWETAPAIGKAWRRWVDNAENLRPQKVGPIKFLEWGLWRDERRWPWDNERLRKQAEARAGSY